MQNFGYSMLWFWAAYLLVSLVGVLHTIFNISVLHMGAMNEHSMGEGYERTKPFHVLYNIVLFPIAAWLYLRGLPSPTLCDALLSAGIWVGITIIFDLFAWVLIRHPWSLSFREFYVDYQPWITLIYLVICLSPLIAFGLMRI